MAVVAKIAVSAAVYAIDKPYSYRVGQDLPAEVGMRCMVPFGKGNRRSEGVILSVEEGSGEGLKAVDRLLDEQPVVSASMLQLAAFLRERYFCTFYQALRAMLPAGMWYSAKDTYSIASLPDDWRQKAKKKPTACAVLDTIVQLGGSAELETLKAQFHSEELEGALRYLLNKKWLTAQTDFLRRVGDKTERQVTLYASAEEAAAYARRMKRAAPVQAAVLELLCAAGSCGAKELCYYTGATTATLNRLEKLGFLEITHHEVLRLPEQEPIEPAKPLELNEEQQRAFEGLLNQFRQEKCGVALLHGVTGSGKTSVYIKLIGRCLREGRQAILLVPEIALTPQLLRVFRAYFGQQVAVLHSSLQMSQRYDTFKRIRRGEAGVVIGTRSAVFAPCPKLGLVILDEEQEHTYLSENTPRYHARDVAMYRGVKEQALVVLGSATPSVESMYRAKTGAYHLYTLTHRFNRQALPPVQLVDMKQELRQGNGGAISRPLLEALLENRQRGQQAILFVNRRGSSRMTLCVDCGYVPSCERCSVHMTYHQANGRLMCHYCGFSQPLPSRCPICGGHLRQVGFGTQRVEEELHSLLPDMEVLRMDADTVSASNSHEVLLKRFQTEQIPILLGTQMVTKGLNFENVTLVGVLNADMSLYAESYRAAETTFDLITQVVGRAGRGGQKGRALIQTMTPENSVLQLAAAQDYDCFYDTEIRLRQLRGCPPFRDLVEINFSGIFEDAVAAASGRFAQMLRRMLAGNTEVALLGPSPASILRVNNRFRYRLSIGCRLDRSLRRLIAYQLQEFAKDRQNHGVTAFAQVNGYD